MKISYASLATTYFDLNSRFQSTNKEQKSSGSKIGAFFVYKDKVLIVCIKLITAVDLPFCSRILILTF